MDTEEGGRIRMYRSSQLAQKNGKHNEFWVGSAFDFQLSKNYCGFAQIQQLFINIYNNSKSSFATSVLLSIKLLLYMNTTLQDQGDTTRYKGVNNSAGKIVKGTLNDAPIKIKVSSIPNKIQNVIFRNYSQPAFGDSKERFFQPSSSMNNFVPGPGVYEISNKTSHIDSKKGSGSFASKTKLQRLQRSRTHVPGPGSYIAQKKSKVKKPLIKMNRSTSQSFFNKSQSTALLSSQLQYRDLFRAQIKKAKNIPAPGIYERQFKEKEKQKSTNVTFKSNLARFNGSQKDTPPVGLYHLQEVQKPKPKTSKYEKVQEEREQTLIKQKQKIQKMLFHKQDKLKLGPGAYNPKFMETTKTFKMKDNMYDRFGKLKSLYALAQSPNISQKPKDLDPDNLLKYSKTTTHMFKSGTKRPQFFVMKEKNDPGKYKNPKSPQKKTSHLINFNKKWVGT